jgi:hypothetical protein
MKSRNVGMLLLSIYLIVVGVAALGGVSLGRLSFLIPIMAIAAGVCLLIGK